MKKEDHLPDCCLATIEEHIAHNDMMACPKCKRIIKVFDSELAFQKFLLFCEAKKRDICTGKFNSYFVVSYISL